MSDTNIHPDDSVRREPVQVITPTPLIRGKSRSRRLQRFGHWLVAAGCTRLLAVLRVHNEFHLEPPLDDFQVQNIASAVGRSRRTASVKAPKALP